MERNVTADSVSEPKGKQEGLGHYDSVNSIDREIKQDWKRRTHREGKQKTLFDYE